MSFSNKKWFTANAPASITTVTLFLISQSMLGTYRYESEDAYYKLLVDWTASDNEDKHILSYLYESSYDYWGIPYH